MKIILKKKGSERTSALATQSMFHQLSRVDGKELTLNGNNVEVEATADRLVLWIRDIESTIQR